MNKLLILLGRLAGILGVLVCLGSGLLRISGLHHVLDIEVVTLFIGGIGLMVMACLVKLYQSDLN